MPIFKRFFPQPTFNDIVSVQPMPMSKPLGILLYVDYKYDTSLELKPGQLEFIEYLRTLYTPPWDLIENIINTHKYRVEDIDVLNRLRKIYRDDYIKYKNDKLQKI